MGLGAIATGLLRAVAQDCQVAAQVELQNKGAQTEVVCITVQQRARPNAAKRSGEAVRHV